jgi:hypothetical protein
VSSELTSVSAILGLHSIPAADKQASSSRIKAAGSSVRSRKSLIGDQPFEQTQTRAVAFRQLHPLLSIVQAIPTESALDAGALGFMAKFLVQTTLPHSEQPGTQYVRTDGNLTLRITDVGATGLPYGSYPRLILIWMTTEAVRTGNRELELGSSLSSFMAQLGLQATGGHWGTIPRFRNQMQRLVGAAISTRWSSDANGQNHSGGENLLVADRFHLWWTPQELPHGILAKSSVTLSVNFFEQLVAAARLEGRPCSQAVATGARSLRMGDAAGQLPVAAHADPLGVAAPELRSRVRRDTARPLLLSSKGHRSVPQDCHGVPRTED